MAQAATPPPSPPVEHLALSEYLDALGLRAADVDYLTTPGNTLEEFIEHKMQEAMQTYVGEYKPEPAMEGEELRVHFANRVLEALDQLEDSESQRYISVPDAPGMTHQMMENWARCVVEQDRQAERMAAIIDASERGAIPRWPPPKPETVSILATEDYEDE